MPVRQRRGGAGRARGLCLVGHRKADEGVLVVLQSSAPSGSPPPLCTMRLLNGAKLTAGMSGAGTLACSSTAWRFATPSACGKKALLVSCASAGGEASLQGSSRTCPTLGDPCGFLFEVRFVGGLTLFLYPTLPTAAKPGERATGPTWGRSGGDRNCRPGDAAREGCDRCLQVHDRRGASLQQVLLGQVP